VTTSLKTAVVGLNQYSVGEKDPLSTDVVV